jgi:hypothetical protein
MIKKITIIVAVVFFGAMALLTVWSRTLMQDNLPKVQLVIPTTGTMDFFYTKYGVAAMNMPKDEYGYSVEVHFDASEQMGPFMWGRGEKVYVTLPAAEVGIDGIDKDAYVQNVIASDVGFDVTVGFTIVGTKAGDSVVVNFRKRTPELYPLVPVAAVHDMYNSISGAYVYVVGVHDGAWGREYTIEKQDVTVGITSGSYVYLPAASFTKPIVLNADAPVFEGTRVRFFP